MSETRPRKFLSSEHIYLRPLNENDISGNYLYWFDDAEVCRGNSHHVLPMSYEDLREFVHRNAGSELNLAMVSAKDHEHIGNISLKNINHIHRTAEFAIILGEKNYWHQGYSKEAGKLIIEHGFYALNLNRIYCGTFETNLGMQKLALSLGFKEEGRRRKAIYKEGNYLDVIEYGLLRSEWENQ